MPVKKTRNNFEKRIERKLKKDRVSYKYEAEKIPYIISAHYIPDFSIDTPLGKVYVETKGYFRREDKRKMAAVKKCNPHLDIRIVFYKYSKVNERWCIKNGFKCAVENIPEEWLLGL